MTDEVAQRILAELRHIQRSMDLMREDVGEMKQLVSAIENHVRGLQAQLSAMSHHRLV